MSRICFVLAFVANLLLTAVSWRMLPDPVASHFGGGGMADGWMSKTGNAVFMTVMEVFLFCTLYFTARMITWIPAKMVSLPNKQYWLQPEHLPQMKEMLTRFMDQFGAAMFVFLFVVGVLVVQANQLDPQQLNEPVFLAALGVFFLYVAIWLVQLYRAFRVPDASSP